MAKVEMIHNTNTNTTAAIDSDSPSPAVFQDFLTPKTAPIHPVYSEDRQVSSYFERISHHAPKKGVSVADISNQLVGRKRNSSNPAFMASSRESFPQMNPETSNVMKMLRSARGGEKPRTSHYDGHPQGVHQMRPVSASLVMQPTSTNVNSAKSERLIPLNSGVNSAQYNSCVRQASPLAYQVPLSRLRDGGSCPSVLSQLAADEGSRTGRKGSGLFSSINGGNVAPERNPSATLPSGYKLKRGTQDSVPELSNSHSERGLTSSSRQMTIIYCGQVHVFDDVHPNKAEIIMALAGSSGGSWYTNLPKSLVGATANGIYSPIGENEGSLNGDSSFPHKYQKVLNAGGTVTKYAGTASQALNSTLEAKQEV